MPERNSVKSFYFPHFARLNDFQGFIIIHDDNYRAKPATGQQMKKC